MQQIRLQLQRRTPRRQQSPKQAAAPQVPLYGKGTFTVDDILQLAGFVIESLKTSIAPKGYVVRTILHIHLGLVVYLAVCAFRKSGLRSRSGLIVLLVLEIVNEGADILRFDDHIPRWVWTDSIGDFVHTLAWPLILFVAAGWLSPAKGPRTCGKQADARTDAAGPA